MPARVEPEPHDRALAVFVGQASGRIGSRGGCRSFSRGSVGGLELDDHEQVRCVDRAQLV
jgi:hypothetical protein